MDVTFRGNSLPAFATGQATYRSSQIFGASSFKSAQSILSSKDKRSEGAESLNAVDVDVQSRRDNSGVRGILSSIKQVTNRLAEINQNLTANGLSEDQRTALEAEKTAMAGEYDRIVGGREYQRFLEVSQSIQGLLSSGADPKAVYKALSSQRGVLGEDYLNLVNSYATTNIGVVNNALSQLTAVSGAAVATDPSALSRVSSLVSSADEALNVPRLSASTPEEKKEEEHSETQIAPKQSELQFVLSNEIAMSLQGYQGRDLLNAALSGIDPKNASYLVLHPPKDLDDDKEDVVAPPPPDLTDPESVG